MDEKEQKFSSNRPEWNQYFMMIAKIVAMRSTCNSRPGGAVIVSSDNRILSTGYNASVAGAFQCSDKGPNYCFRRDKKIKDEEKYNVCKALHAEQNAILYAAKYGVSLINSKIYCTLQPCYICTKLIAGVGIKTVYFELLYESKDRIRDNRWRRSLDEYGIVYKQVKVEKHNISRALEFLSFPTSYRRLEPE